MSVRDVWLVGDAPSLLDASYRTAIRGRHSLCLAKRRATGSPGWEDLKVQVRMAAATPVRTAASP